ncbi:NADPH-dependent FMN reductase [Chthonobacter albigriseus]|uniref:NADPH-dependent FMN reductase n=1 Tax=Chthonobacter albigriseus TaxID=1683161 RepID=UPI0015EEDF82|nr:NAD(P)H-dependent oxidoreductase [Chthonobacter albigriseus]
MNDTLNLALVYGSAREGRFCDTVSAWARSEIEADGRFSLDIIDPAALPPTRDGAGLLKAHVANADAFIVVTPEYNHGYPADLKALIDRAYAEWNAKPVAFVSYGGASGGLRAVEQLRQVFAELHAVTIRDSVMFPNAWKQFGEDGRLLAPEGPQAAMRATLARLWWWADALRAARWNRPYNEAA